MKHFAMICCSLMIYLASLNGCSVNDDHDGNTNKNEEKFSFNGEIIDTALSFYPNNDDDDDSSNWQYGTSVEDGAYSFAILFSENNYQNIFISTKNFSNEYLSTGHINSFFQIGYMRIGDTDYDFEINIQKNLPIDESSSQVDIYTTKGQQEETAFYISNIEKYFIESKSIYLYKITANINANLYNSNTGEYVGRLSDAEFIFGIASSLGNL